MPLFVVTYVTQSRSSVERTRRRLRAASLNREQQRLQTHHHGDLHGGPAFPPRSPFGRNGFTRGARTAGERHVPAAFGRTRDTLKHITPPSWVRQNDFPTANDRIMTRCVFLGIVARERARRSSACCVGFDLNSGTHMARRTARALLRRRRHHPRVARHHRRRRRERRKRTSCTQ